MIYFLAPFHLRLSSAPKQLSSRHMLGVDGDYGHMRDHFIIFRSVFFL